MLAASIARFALKSKSARFFGRGKLAAGDVGAGDDVEQRLVITHGPGPVAPSEVAVEVDVHVASSASAQRAGSDAQVAALMGERHVDRESNGAGQDVQLCCR